MGVSGEPRFPPNPLLYILHCVISSLHDIRGTKVPPEPPSLYRLYTPTHKHVYTLPLKGGGVRGNLGSPEWFPGIEKFSKLAFEF